MSFTLMKRKRYRGQGLHLSGWPWICERLQQESDGRSILLDDFVEHSMDGPIYSRNCPWVGIFHHPPNEIGDALYVPIAPDNYKMMPDKFLKRPKLQQALRKLRLAITLSVNLAQWLKRQPQINCPVVALKHPIKKTEKLFRPDILVGERPIRLFHYGTYLKNVRILHQLPKVDGFFMERVEPIRLCESQWDAACWTMIPNRPNNHAVTSIPRQTPEQMDYLLSTSVVVFEYFGLAASNALLECIIRNTPVIVNRVPAAVEYLGEGYPLFYDGIKDIRRVLNRSTIYKGYQYLEALDKSNLTLDRFVRDLKEVIDTRDAPEGPYVSSNRT